MVLFKGVVDCGMLDVVYVFVNGLFGGFYGCEFGVICGYMVLIDKNVEYVKVNLNEYKVDEVVKFVDYVKVKFFGKVYW